MSDPSRQRPPEVEKAFFETDDAEARAFGERQTGRKIALLVATLVAVIGAGVAVALLVAAGLKSL